MSAERKKILIEASGCHVHLTQAAIETLFGPGGPVLKKRPGIYPNRGVFKANRE